MADTKISAAPDAGTLLSNDMLPIARSGNTSAFRSSVGSVASYINAQVTTPTYGDNDTSIATTAFVQTAVAPYQNNVGRNLLHNSMFNVQQRGTGPWTTDNTYTADRWVLYKANDTVSVALYVSSNGLSGDEGLVNFVGVNVTGSATAGSYSDLAQRIEDVRRLAGKTVTVSFGANAGSGTPKLGIEFVQQFGGGGSAAVGVAQQSVTLSTAQTRYSLTFVLPSVSGKTLGTGHNTQLNFVFSQQGGLGVQTANINIWGIQLEIGTQATPLDYGGTPQQQLAECQRFFCTGGVVFYGYNTATHYIGQSWPFPVTMRATPTIAIPSSSGSYNIGTIATAATTQQASFNAAVTATADAGLVCTFTASADL